MKYHILSHARCSSTQITKSLHESLNDCALPNDPCYELLNTKILCISDYYSVLQNYWYENRFRSNILVKTISKFLIFPDDDKIISESDVNYLVLERSDKTSSLISVILCTFRDNFTKSVQDTEFSISDNYDVFSLFILHIMVYFNEDLLKHQYIKDNFSYPLVYTDKSGYEDFINSVFSTDADFSRISPSTDNRNLINDPLYYAIRDGINSMSSLNIRFSEGMAEIADEFFY